MLEVVIVVVIIGLVAAVAVPRIGRAGSASAEAAVKGNLETLRSAIDLYAAEHLGAFPGLHRNDGSQDENGDEDDFYAQLLECSSETGLTGACTYPRIYGPYLRAIPSLTVGRNSMSDRMPDEVKFKTEVPLDEHEGDKTGWIYNPENGRIIANTKAVDSQGTPFIEY